MKTGDIVLMIKLSLNPKAPSSENWFVTLQTTTKYRYNLSQRHEANLGILLQNYH
jgi:hypothetical protein